MALLKTGKQGASVEALPGRQEGFSGLEAGSAKEPAAGLLWMEVEGHEEPHTTSHSSRDPSPQGSVVGRSQMPVMLRGRAQGFRSQGSHMGQPGHEGGKWLSPGTSAESPRALGSEVSLEAA